MIFIIHLSTKNISQVESVPWKREHAEEHFWQNKVKKIRSD